MVERPKVTLASLGIDAEYETKGVPTGGAGFGASSFIGPWLCRTIYSLGYEGEIEDVLSGRTVRIETKDGETTEIGVWPPDYPINSGNGWEFVQYREYAVARAVAAILDEDKPRRPSTVLRFTMDTADVMNVADLDQLAEAFGDHLVFDVAVKALSHSEKYPAKARHCFHAFSMPSAVAAVAVAMEDGDAIFDIGFLTTPEARDMEMTDSLYHFLVGDPVAGMWSEIEIDFEDEHVARIAADLGIEPPTEEDEVLTMIPLLSQRRTELWERLGDPNFKAYTASTTLTAGGKGAKTNAVKDSSLDRCIKFLMTPWSKPIFCRLTMVPDVRPEAVSRAGNRLAIGCITDVFGTGDQARQFAADIAAEELGDSDVVKTKAGPEKSEGWVSSTEETILEYMREHDPDNDMPEGPAVEKLYMDNIETLRAWRAYEESTRGKSR